MPRKSENNTTQIGELIHTDIWGPANTISIHGNKYFVTLTDDFSRHLTVAGLKRKSDVVDVFREYMVMFELQTGRRIKAVRSDNGGEYDGNFTMLLRKHGIRHFKSVPYCSWQNGIAERLNRTLLEGARSMLFEKKLPKNLWELAVKYMCYVRNRVPTEKVCLR